MISGYEKFDYLLYNLKPDIIVTIADRFETIATSISATYQNIPLAHIQGGEVTGNIDEKVKVTVYVNNELDKIISLPATNNKQVEVLTIKNGVINYK